VPLGITDRRLQEDDFPNSLARQRRRQRGRNCGIEMVDEPSHGYTVSSMKAFMEYLYVVFFFFSSPRIHYFLATTSTALPSAGGSRRRQSAGLDSLRRHYHIVETGIPLHPHLLPAGLHQPLEVTGIPHSKKGTFVPIMRCDVT